MSEDKNTDLDDRISGIIEGDPLLKPYAPILTRRAGRVLATETRLTGEAMRIADFAAGTGISVSSLKRRGGFSGSGRPMQRRFT